MEQTEERTKSVKVVLDIEDYEVFKSRKVSKGITLDFQLTEAIKMYVAAIKKKEGGVNE